MGRIIEEIYVWRLPVRLYHWINALCILLLLVTGFYIAGPVLMPPSGEAVSSHALSWWRMLHFGAAFLFIANFLFRMYWALFGRDRYARFGGFRPWSPRWWGNRSRSRWHPISF